MFTKICIDNFMGISNKIDFNFIAESRNKEGQANLYKTSDGIYINKLIGILGSNGVGKSSSICAIGKIGSLMHRPILQVERKKNFFDFLDYEKNIENLKSHMEEITSVDIKEQNASRLNEDTYIEIEMYIEEKDEMTGYYKYIISFNGISKKITKEIFTFRKKYKGKEEELINIENANECQMYYIDKYFENLLMISSIDTDKLKVIQKHIEVFRNHYLKNSRILFSSIQGLTDTVDYIKFYDNNRKFMEEAIKIVDPKIDKIIIKTNEEDDKELEFILKSGGRITQEDLSTGTIKFLNTIISIVNIIKNRGILVIDEIEQNMHKELVYLILRLFMYLDKNSTQIIFTTHFPEIFDYQDESGHRFFKQDAIYLINNEENKISAQKVSKIRINDKRIKGDISINSLYKNELIATQPSIKEINRFIEGLKN